MGAKLCCLGCADKEIKPKLIGLRKERNCTDVVCLIFYAVFVLGFFAISLIAFLYGDLNGPKRDSDGNACDVAVNAGKPNLYVQNPDGIFTQLFFEERANSRMSICVEKCPDFSFNTVYGELTDEILDKYKKLCKYPDLLNADQVGASYVVAECMPFVVPTKSLNNLCVPDIGLILEAADQQVNKTTHALGYDISASVFIDESIADAKAAWKFIVGIILGAAFVSLSITLSMRWISGVSVWLCFITFLGGIAVGLAFSLWKYIGIKNEPGAQQSLKDVPYAFWNTNMHFWLYLAIFFMVLLLLMLLIIIGLRKRIHKAIAVMKIASKAVASSPFIAIFPIFFFVCSCVIMLIFFVAFFSLHTMPIKLDNSAFQWLSDNVVLFKLLLLFTCTWQICALSGFQTVTFAGTYSEYYWNGSSSLRDGVNRALSYHLGSICLGSFIIASLRFMLFFLALLVKSKKLTSKLKKAAKVLACCLGYIERIMNYINNRAYIMLAVKGKPYVKSAQMAMGLIIRNPLYAAVLDCSSVFVILVARLIVVGLSIGISYVLFYIWPPETIEALNNPVVPIVIIAIGSYIVSYPFFLVHSVAISTIFLSFLEDCEVNDGTPEKPYANKSTQKYFGKKIAKLKKQNGKYESVE